MIPTVNTNFSDCSAAAAIHQTNVNADKLINCTYTSQPCVDIFHHSETKKGTVDYFGKCGSCVSCQALKELGKVTVVSIWWLCGYCQQLWSLVQRLDPEEHPCMDLTNRI